MYSWIRIASTVVLAAGCVGVSGCKKSDADLPATDATAPVPAAIETSSPESADPARKYDGMIVHQPDAGRGKDDGWFLVKDGKRRWITEAEWLEPNGYRAEDVIYITSQEFKAIPEDPRPLPETDQPVGQ